MRLRTAGAALAAAAVLAVAIAMVPSPAVAPGSCRGEPPYCQFTSARPAFVPERQPAPPHSAPSYLLVSTQHGSTYTLTSAAEGVRFDMDGDGAPEQIAWTAPGSDIAFLALDQDGDGAITSGKELLGNATVAGARNAVSALTRIVRDANGRDIQASVTAGDAVFARLLLWTDANHNGKSEQNELRTAAEHVTAIGLGYGYVRRHDPFGNFFNFHGWVRLRNAPGGSPIDSAEHDRARTRDTFEVVPAMR